MTAIASAEVIAELETAVSTGSPERRVLMLRRVTHLFLSSADRLNECQIGVFDDVLVRLIQRIDAPSLVQLGSTLTELTPAPKQAVRHLACHEEIAVAAPVLLRAHSISEGELVEIAGSVGRQHLLAIASRRFLDEALTDVLLRRGDIDVCHVLAKNAGAKFSESGHAALVTAAARNNDIAESLALRSDLPPAMLRELLLKSTDAVRLRLLKAAPPKLRQNIREVLDSIAAHVSTKAPEPGVYSEARSRIVALNNSGKLNDSTVNRFALRREATNVIASLSVLSGATIEAIEPLMEEKTCYGLVVACRASRLDWQTTLAIIRSRSVPQLSEQELVHAKEQFERLFLSTAQRTVRFGILSNSTEKPGLTEKALATAGANR
jgi:uncharacterized protein (DUF2336 family)